MMLRLTTHTPDEPMPGDLCIDPEDVEAVLEVDFIAPRADENTFRRVGGHVPRPKLEKRRLAIVHMRNGREFVVWDSDRDVAERISRGKSGIGEDMELA